MKARPPWLRFLLRWLFWLLLAGLALQLFFLLRIASMVWIDPVSTTFQRSEAWRIMQVRDELRWAQQWVPYEAISPHLKRAVIASEDAAFATHFGVDWQALQSAWERNLRRQAVAEARGRNARLVGGSTITQQLAKNLLLSGERTLLRKGQELVLSKMLELLLSKERILEIYLNSVEWGEGIFGAEAAAQHYFRKPAARLSAHEAARLAVLLPAPKRFQRQFWSDFIDRRSATVLARMGDVQLP
ncbi:membrane carboxypeptidase, penicillin-binding protein [Serpentinimonas raichei]|jgi:monofunctional biosynthetic peptidoglycan transglycosylase|uniref:Biosynthetic peptidoglycan transglycosylase n=1 Tax=Serpentinimonas raichei TaxID=1458425 RepID=A0A060NJT3_9BURK|nr:membrane carboxypeptidase, penicillin-binding protein [Serpentinimonas raichei]